MIGRGMHGWVGEAATTTGIDTVATRHVFLLS
jgi:hypothetical protein